MSLFKEPFDMAAIDRALGADWPHFADAAFVVTGVRARWEAAADQLARMFAAFAVLDRDEAPLYRVFDLLGERALWFDDAADAQQSLLDRLIPDGPRIALSARMASIHKVDPLWRERQQHQHWLRQHIALLKAMREPAPDVPLTASPHLVKSMRDADALRGRTP